MPNNDYLKLRECPFCGCKAKLFQAYDGTYIVQCICCSNGTLHWKCAETAIEHWNRRAEHGKND